ncbi:inverse autotransporter beta domain-containing protein [Candidatus Paracaedibacter symbiosus]|uniref:inverse autotransporter beta domain-containing protein n=1 Tax=Candidatus Paracaedibacter symbiosus TaxID=244582 RepID=UPI0018DC621B|nr:inverse autotransporter beta domain-containing protein [Candidatus Paracaedibacter symbiosus]
MALFLPDSAFSNTSTDTAKDSNSDKKTQNKDGYFYDKKWQPTINLGGKYGNQRHIGQLALLSPLWQNDTELLYVDFRFMADSKPSREGNFGIGKRWITGNQKFILGVYGFYDRRRTEFSNFVNQITFGLEALSETWDYRVNFYYTQNTSKEIEKSKEEVKGKPWTKYQGHNEYIYTPISLKTLKTKEVPLKGLDLEIGNAIPGLNFLRVYGAYYHFQGHSGAKSINGVRARANMQLHDNFSLIVEGSHDNVRKRNAFIGFQLRVPLGESNNKVRKLTALEKRMTDLPELGIDTITNVAAPTVDISHLRTDETVINNVYFVEKDGASSPADPQGQYENPYSLKELTHLDSLKSKLQQDGGDKKWISLSNGKYDGEILAGDLLRQVEATHQLAERQRQEAEHLHLEHQRRQTERLEAVRLEAAARLEAVRLEVERLEAVRLEVERLEAARLEAERLETVRLEAERLEAAARLEAARLEAKRLEAAARLEAERLEAVRLEVERLEAERLEAAARLEAARLEAERLEAAARLEAAHLEAERLEAAARLENVKSKKG